VETDAFDLAKQLWKKNLHQVDSGDFSELEAMDKSVSYEHDASSNALELGL